MRIWQRLFTRSFSGKKTNNGLLFGGMFALLAVGLWAALFFGSTRVSVAEALNAWWSGNVQNAAYRILFFVRLPRVAAAVLAGSALAVSGVLIQAVLNNPMAAPNIIGVNAGAGLAAVILIAVFPAAIGWMPAAAFAGAMGACLCIYAIASVTGAARMTITLVGIAVSSILSAGISAVKTLFPDSVYDANAFQVGGLAGVSAEKLNPAWALILVGILIAWGMARDVDVLSLGSDTAQSLGMPVKWVRFWLLVLASLLAGAAVSFAGLLGFIGLVVPHIGRRIVGSRHRVLIPFCALGGAILVLLCDLIARVLFAPYELPVGILLSFVGGPFFILLIFRKRKGTDHD